MSLVVDGNVITTTGRIYADGVVVDCNTSPSVTTYIEGEQGWGSYSDSECITNGNSPDVFITDYNFVKVKNGFTVVSKGFTQGINVTSKQTYIKTNKR